MRRSTRAVALRPTITRRTLPPYFKTAHPPLRRFSSNTARSMNQNQPISLQGKGIVEPEFLHQHLGSIHVLDGSWCTSFCSGCAYSLVINVVEDLPKFQRNPRKEFSEIRIPGAQFFDIDEIADKSSSLPHMLPSAADFEQAMSSMGIGTDEPVVVYDGAGVHSAPRVWWTFRAFGHDNVAVLNGGLVKWRARNFETESGPEVVKKKPAVFKARPRPELVYTLQQLEANPRQMVDARPEGRFLGKEPEPRPGLLSGHIPGSLNTPSDRFVDDANHRSLLPLERLRELFKRAEVNPTAPTMTTCGSGLTACVPALALYLLGNENVAVYDASWAEYGRIERQKN